MRLGLFSRGAAHGGWLAIGLEHALARFAHVMPGSRPRVTFLEERALDGEPKSLERVAKALDAARYRCTTLLVQSEYQMVVVEAPPVPEQELKSAARWRIKDMIDYPPDQAAIDLLPIPSSAGRASSIYVVAARSETVRQAIARFRNARIPLEVIDVPDTAQRNVAALFEPTERAVLTLSLHADAGLITISAGGELYASRRLDISSTHLDGDEAARSRAQDRVLVEVQRSLDSFERSFPHLAVGKVLLAPTPRAEELTAHLAANLYLPVNAIELADVMDLPPTYSAAAPAARAAWFRLIGAGLRTEG